MYICMYVYVCMYVCIHPHTHTHTHTHTQTHTNNLQVFVRRLCTQFLSRQTSLTNCTSVHTITCTNNKKKVATKKTKKNVVTKTSSSFSAGRHHSRTCKVYTLVWICGRKLVNLSTHQRSLVFRTCTSVHTLTCTSHHSRTCKCVQKLPYKKKT